jgi:aryl-alcohol dehydrogenase-like predicted oxidoreductase
MIYNLIPNTSIKVSKICLGTMTFGQQNNEADAHEQLDFALSNGINFIDTAEMYSVPGRIETQGSTEHIIGTWIAKRKNRDRFVLATKVAGPSQIFNYIRPNLGFSKEAILDALHKSMQRLQTDYIDLYQLHWPDRNANYFGKLGYKHQEDENWQDNILEVIEILDTLVKEGKIRHYGLSNETPWGLMRHLKESESKGLTRVLTIQNPYSLLNRSFEIGLAEVAMREKVGLLAYSPLGFGVLSGKYRNGQKPPEARLNLFPQMNRYSKPQTALAVEKYAILAENNGLSLAQLALAFVNQQAFVTSNIIGATGMSQLKENIDSVKLHLSNDILEEIDKIHELFPNPSP